MKAGFFSRHYGVRYNTLAACVVGLVISLAWLMHYPWRAGFGVLFFGTLVVIGIRDLRQTRHAVLRNYPVIGHMRFLFEYIRPEMRQYFIESDSEAAPFSRAQRSLVYQRAKGEQDNRPFGTQLDVTRQGYEWINHSMFPTVLASSDFRVTIGPANRTAVPVEHLQYLSDELWFALRKCDSGLEPGRQARRIRP